MELHPIIEFTTAHTAQIGELILGIQQKEFGIPITIEEQPDLGKIPTFYQVNQGNFWVALEQGNVIGTIGLLDIGNRQAALRKMFVDRRYRGKDHGVGQALLEKLIDWAREKKFKEIFLGTSPLLPAARRFYEKNAFVEVQKEQLPPAFPIVHVDTIFYSLSLDS